MKKQLLLTIMIGYATLLNGMDKQAIVQFDPNYKPESIDVQVAFQPWVNKVTKKTALATGILGVGASAAYFYKNPDLKTIKHAVYAMGATVGATVLSALIANRWAKSKVNEYTDINHPLGAVVSQHNYAVNASDSVHLTYEQRKNLSKLPFDKPAIDTERLDIYNTIKIVHRNIRGHPILDRVHLLSDKATALEAERTLTDNIVNFLLDDPVFDLTDELKAMKDLIRKNKQQILLLNNVLSHNNVREWCKHVKQNAPEYKWHKKRLEFSKAEEDLKEQERVIGRDLVRLATIYGNSFRDIAPDPSRLFGMEFKVAPLENKLGASWAEMAVYYPNTPKENAQKEQDILDTKKRISDNIEHYKESAENYNKTLNEFKKRPHQLSEEIESFIQKKGINTYSLSAYRTNNELLQYEEYLNRDSIHFVIWIRGILFHKS